MPANLTPEYLEAEAKFKLAKTISEKIKFLEIMLAVIPKHKGTERLRGQLKSRMAKLREELQKKPILGKAEQAYSIGKEGAAQILLLGLPNSGKSSLFSHVTHASSEVADYPFTTQKPIPGMMKFENIQIQLIDTPPIQRDQVEPGLSNLVRNADALVIVVDLTADPLVQMEVVLEVLERMKIRIREPRRMPQGETGWIFPKALVLANKCDASKAMEEYRALQERFGGFFTLLPISAKQEMNLESAGREIYQILDVLRVYTKSPGKEPDLTEPVILKKGSTVEEVALSVHKDFVHKLRYAKIWGSGKFGGQMVRRDFVVNEGDIVELHL